jgi:hypothetical protein
MLPAASLFFLHPFLSLSSSSLLTLPVSLHNQSPFSPVSHLSYSCLPIVAIPLLFVSPSSSCLPLLLFSLLSLSPFSFCLLFLSTFASYLAPLPISVLFLFHFSYSFPLFLFLSLLFPFPSSTSSPPLTVSLFLLPPLFVFLPSPPPFILVSLVFLSTFLPVPSPFFLPPTDVSFFFQSS